MSGKLKILIILLLSAALVVVFFLVSDVRDLCAHTPHDQIDAVELSPAYDQDQTLFIVILDRILKSTDGGSSWKELVNGLDKKHLLSSIAISPSYLSDKTLFLSSQGDGIYKSQDGGSSWIKVNDGLGNLNLGLLAIHPDFQSSRIVLAAGAEGGLFKTKDGGDSWYQVLDDSIKITAMAFSPDLEKDHAFIGDRRGILYVSTDGGEAWQQIFDISGAGAITSIAISPRFASDGELFIGTEERGVFKTIDGAASFTAVNDGLSFDFRGRYLTFRKSEQGPVIRRSEKDVISFAISPSYETDSTIFASMWNEAIYKSEDGGDSWKRYDLGLTCDFQADAAFYKSPHFRAVRISNAFAEDGTVFLAGFDGLFKSTDGGRHWTQLETLPLRLVKGLGLSPGDKDSLSIAITTYGGGAYTKQGTRWAVNNTGLDRTRLTDIVFSPNYHSDNTIFSASRGYLLKSTDRGSSWDRIALRYESWRTRVSSILKRRLGLPNSIAEAFLSRDEREVPWPYVIAISPNFATDNTLFFGTRTGHGIFRSVDGGRGASVVWDAKGKKTVTSLVISPDFSSDRTLFAAVRDLGIYRTVDGGDTWQPANNGLKFVEDWQSATEPDDPEISKRDIQLAISPHYYVDKTIFAATPEGLFKTTNGGESWQKLKGAAYGGDGYVMSIAISPNHQNDETLIISVKGRGLFKTSDGGTTFAEIGSALIDHNHQIELLAFSASYATDHTIYAASHEELFESTDGGNTWEIITRPVRYEDRRDVIHFEGEWKLSKGDDFSASSVSYSDAAFDKATLNFVGTGVSWIGTKSNDQGIARVFIDGDYLGDVDQFSATRKFMVTSFSITDLAYGPHTIGVEVTGTKNPESAGYRIEVDAFDVFP